MTSLAEVIKINLTASDCSLCILYLHQCQRCYMPQGETHLQCLLGDNGAAMCALALFSPADVCLNFSLFFFLHFQGLNRRPSVANLLRRRMGGVCVPGTSESDRIAANLSTSSAVKQQEAHH